MPAQFLDHLAGSIFDQCDDREVGAVSLFVGGRCKVKRRHRRLTEEQRQARPVRGGKAHGRGPKRKWIRKRAHIPGRGNGRSLIVQDRQLTNGFNCVIPFACLHLQIRPAQLQADLPEAAIVIFVLRNI